MNERRSRNGRALGRGMIGLTLLLCVAGCESRPPLNPASDPNKRMGEYQQKMEEARNKKPMMMPGGAPGMPSAGMPGRPAGMPPGGMPRR
jgi:hypothetical protein